MAYKVYITKDYKNGVIRKEVRAWSPFLLLGPLVVFIFACLMWGFSDEPVAAIAQATSEKTGSIIRYDVNVELIDGISPATESFASDYRVDDELGIIKTAEALPVSIIGLDPFAEQGLQVLPEAMNEPNTANPQRQRVKVKAGDSLALIFSRLGLSPGELYNVMSLGKKVSQLKRLKPDQILYFHVVENELLVLEYELDLTHTLKIVKQDEVFSAEVVVEELESVVKIAHATIKGSLFVAAKGAGLPDKLIMQMVAIYGWDIDFALDVHANDTFSLIYKEQYKNGIKVAVGPIIAAEFVNRSQALRAVRYTHADGMVDYYSDNGDAMRKAFIRTPLEFTRISSHFNLKRKHPILNKIRAHKGIDYAAPIGTPVKAAGDGKVAAIGRDRGYGKRIILKHGQQYKTVYAHLNGYVKGLHVGKYVKQGQIIGYVGKTGLATGPHLHYEFRVNNTHRNPLTVKLPKAESINPDLLPAFRKTITPFLVELDQLSSNSIFASQQPFTLPTQQPKKEG